MASTKALVAKDQGNAAFKAGDYPTAIGHYTTAILADRTDATYPLNRAAAYLKLGKNEDAERDCTSVLAINPSNVKALFRRGQAKVSQNKLVEAQGDLKEALRLEPANGSIKQELKKVADLIQIAQNKQRPKSNAAIAPPPSAPLSKCRRVPIEIVEPVDSSSSSFTSTKPRPDSKSDPPTEATECNDLLKPVSSRILLTPSVLSATSPGPSVGPASVPLDGSTAKPNSFKEAKVSRQSAKPSRVGGGIFRSSGDHTLFDPKHNDTSGRQASSSTLAPAMLPSEGRPPDLSSELVSNSKLLAKPPMSLFEFIRSWESLECPEKRWQLISSIPPASLPTIFQASLETSLLVSLLRTFLTTLNQRRDDSAIKHQIQDYMASLARVQRFSTVILFMSKEEKKLVKDIWAELGVGIGGSAWGIN